MYSSHSSFLQLKEAARHTTPPLALHAYLTTAPKKEIMLIEILFSFDFQSKTFTRSYFCGVHFFVVVWNSD